MVDIKQLKREFVNCESVKYTLKKGGDIFIKPMLVKNYFDYEDIFQIFSIDKNEFGFIEFIQMSYLQFLYTMMSQRETGLSMLINNSLISFTELCLGYKNINFGIDNNKVSLLLCDDDYNIEKIIKPKEFDDIMKIFLYQNNFLYEEREISSDMKKIMEDYYRIKYQNINIPSFEQKKAFVSSKIHKTFKELNELTIREFELVYQSCVDNELFIAQKIIQASYKYDIGDVQFPLYEQKKDPYEEILSGKQDLSMLNGIDNIGMGIE